MLGDLINRCLILALGYAYPGFECYKVVEKNRVDMEELRFWCKYWIILALFTVLEKFADIFIAWLPMYGEMKLVLIIYLWYPKTKGTGFIYETVLRPYVSKHENDIDRKLLEWKARAWDFIIFYWQYCAKYGQTAFFQVLQYLALQSNRISANPTTLKSEVHHETESASPSMQQSSSFKLKQSSSISKSKKWPPSPPSSPSIHRNISETPKSRIVEVDLDFQTEYSEEDEAILEPEPVTIDEGQDVSHVNVKDRINRARARLRKIDSQNSRTPRTPQRKDM
ncbi:unnamed protein product [Lupinus luteus]|uniref:HVA22-like protein n=1 Tax=Lupinus luteus TaxID=3873 RepID=A0AAV1X5W0_LUPLU